MVTIEGNGTWDLFVPLHSEQETNMFKYMDFTMCYGTYVSNYLKFHVNAGFHEHN
jgi:hypothetical protein